MNSMHASLFSATILPESTATVYTETAIRRKTNVVASDNGCHLILHFLYSTQFRLSPPQRLPLGIPIKISIIALSFSFSPASPQYKEASAEERAVSLLSVIFEESNNLKAFPQKKIIVRRRME